jgi:lysophospholipase L1-like esterase
LQAGFSHYIVDALDRSLRSNRNERRKTLSNAFFLSFVVIFCILETACSSLWPTQASTSIARVQPLPTARITYVAIGASDTFGIGADDPIAQNWAADLAQNLGKGVHFVNLGVPGADVSDALNEEVPVAIDAHPTLITVWLAVNDLADKVPVAIYQRNLNTLLDRLHRGAPHARIAVANVPDLAYVPHFNTVDAQVLQSQIAAYNNAIAQAVSAHHVLLVDLYGRWQALADHPEYISGDGFHPSTIGYQQIATIFYQTLQS